jgi:hypothetical protein
MFVGVVLMDEAEFWANLHEIYYEVSVVEVENKELKTVLAETRAQVANLMVRLSVLERGMTILSKEVYNEK